jgi:hypothetical protein
VSKVFFTFLERRWLEADRCHDQRHRIDPHLDTVDHDQRTKDFPNYRSGGLAQGFYEKRCAIFLQLLFSKVSLSLSSLESGTSFGGRFFFLTKRL